MEPIRMLYLVCKWLNSNIRMGKIPNIVSCRVVCRLIASKPASLDVEFNSESYGMHRFALDTVGPELSAENRIFEHYLKYPSAVTTLCRPSVLLTTILRIKFSIFLVEVIFSGRRRFGPCSPGGGALLGEVTKGINIRLRIILFWFLAKLLRATSLTIVSVRIRIKVGLRSRISALTIVSVRINHPWGMTTAAIHEANSAPQDDAEKKHVIYIVMNK